MAKLGPNEFYCCSCRKKVKCRPSDIHVKVYKNPRNHQNVPALKGACKCGCPLTKFIKVDSLAAAKKKYH